MDSPRIDGSSVKSRRDVVRRTIVACALVSVIAYGLICSVEWHRRALAQELCADIQQLRVGTTTDTDVQRLSRKYKGTLTSSDSDQPAHYLVSIWSPLLIVGRHYCALPGRKTWAAQAYLQIEHGHLSKAHFALTTYRSDGLALSGSARLTGSQPLAAPEGLSYFVYQAHVTGPATESLNVELSPGATPNEYRKGFDFNFSCTTGFLECKHVCELMPTAWRDLAPPRRIREPNGGAEGIDSDCP